MPEQVLHKGLTAERWNQFPLRQRLQMIESEFLRAAALLKEGEDRVSAKRCYFRAKELILWTLESLDLKQQSNSAIAFFKAVVRTIEQEDFDSKELSRLVFQSEDLARLFSEALSL